MLHGLKSCDLYSHPLPPIIHTLYKEQPTKYLLSNTSVFRPPYASNVVDLHHWCLWPTWIITVYVVGCVTRGAVTWRRST